MRPHMVFVGCGVFDVCGIPIEIMKLMRGYGGHGLLRKERYNSYGMKGELGITKQ